MDYKTGLLVFTLLAGCFALPTPDNDVSKFFHRYDASARLVGGKEAAMGSHPHMVALSSGLMVRGFLCGGSLITQRTILTAAHCIEHVFSYGSLTSTLRATVGTNHWTLGGTTYTIAHNVTHPNYDSFDLNNDVGLLITSTDVQLSNLVQLVGITYEFIEAGTQAKVAGWGRIAVNGAVSAALLELDTTTISGEECVAAVDQAAIDFELDPPPVEKDIEVCTFHSAGHGTCSGDSGSAVLRVDNKLQFGVVSWSFPCALGVPDMSVRLSAYEDFITSNTV